MSFLRKHWPWIFLLLIPLIPLWRTVFCGEAIGPFDQIRQMAPWHGPKPTQPWDVLQADGALQFYVWRDLVFDAWGKGSLPFWNPYELAGTPLLANSQSAVFYPPHILLGILHVPTALGITLLAWFHLFLAGLGVAKLSERLGASRLGSVVAGTSFSLSAFMVSWTALSSVITTVAWIPWVLYCIALLFEQNAKWRTAFCLALCTGMMVLGGHLQFVAYGFIAAIIFALGLTICRWKQRPGQAIGRIGVGLVLGLLLAGPQLLPVLKYSEFSHRKREANAEGYQSYLGGALKPFQLANTGYALSTGNPREAAEGADGISTYWPALAKQGDNFAESAISLGPLVLALLFLAPWRRKSSELTPVAIFGLVALLLAFGTILNGILYYFVPGWSSTASPGRIGVLFVMAACVIGGVGISNLPKLPEKGYARLLPIVLPALLAALFLGFGNMAELPDKMAEAIGAIRSEAVRAAAPGLLISAILAAVGIAMAYRIEKLSSKIVVLLVPIGIALCSGTASLVMTGEPLAKVAGPADSYARVAIVNEPWGLLQAAPALLPPNLAALNRIHELAGYDSLLHRDTKKLLDDINGGNDSAPPANGNMMFIKPTFDWEALMDAGVSEVWSTKPLPIGNFPSHEDNGILKYDFTKHPNYVGRAVVNAPNAPLRPAKVTGESFTQVRVDAEGPGQLTLVDRYMPGWLAKIDGQHVELKTTGSSDKPETWLGVELPPGQHKVEFNYVPPGFMTGVYLAFPAWLICLGGIGLALRKKTVA